MFMPGLQLFWFGVFWGFGVFFVVGGDGGGVFFFNPMELTFQLL